MFLGLDILFLGIAEALGIVYVGVGGEADEAVVNRTVFLADKVGVVGGDNLDAVLFRQFEYLLSVVALLLVKLVGQAGDLCLVLHHLKIIIVPKHALVPGDGPVDGFLVAGHYCAGDLSGQAGAAANEALMVLFNYLVAYPWPVVHTVHVAL